MKRSIRAAIAAAQLFAWIGGFSWIGGASTVCAQSAPSDTASGASAQDPSTRPFVKGGIDDKPYLLRARGASLGGYFDSQYRHERANGALDEASFVLERLNLFTYAALSERIRLASEIEFEEGGEEVKIELAILDFEIHPVLTFRGGMLLSPLGRFNLAHDSPANDLVDRPLVSTEIIPTTLSEPGLGFLGAFFPTTRSRLTYEMYLVNGFDDGVIQDEGRTFIPAGKGNFEDNNGRPSFVGRWAASPVPSAELGFSLHTGPFNDYEVEGVQVDDRRDVTILALDAGIEHRAFRFAAELADASIDVPPQTGGLFAESQRGFYAELGATFLEGAIGSLPQSRFHAAARYDFVDFDTDTDGDDVRQLTIGVGFRPIPDSVFKLDWQRGWSTDAFENEENEAAFLFGLASYF